MARDDRPLRRTPQIRSLFDEQTTAHTTFISDPDGGVSLLVEITCDPYRFESYRQDARRATKVRIRRSPGRIAVDLYAAHRPVGRTCVVTLNAPLARGLEVALDRTFTVVIFHRGATDEEAAVERIELPVGLSDVTEAELDAALVTRRSPSVRLNPRRR